MIKKYIKKPFPVEAIQFTGMNESEISEFAKGKIWVNQQIDPNTKYIEKNPWNTLTRYSIDTLEGEMRFDVGDYIVKGIKGEFYAVDKEIFEETYEEASNIGFAAEQDMIQETAEQARRTQNDQ